MYMAPGISLSGVIFIHHDIYNPPPTTHILDELVIQFPMMYALMVVVMRGARLGKAWMHSGDNLDSSRLDQIPNVLEYQVNH